MTKPKSAAKAPLAARPSDDPTYSVDPGRGWIRFAGIMLAVVGVVNVVYGIAAIDESTFYVREVEFVIGDLKTWGWFLLIVGAIQAATSVGIFRSAEWARWLGITFAVINGFLQFIFMPAHPVLSLMLFFVNMIIVYGLITYGGHDRRSLAG